MEYLFRILFGKGAATSIAAMLLFTMPEVTLKDSSVVIRGALDGIFTSRVERILHTGTEVTVTYDFSVVFEDENGRTVENREVKHRIRYDDLEKKFQCRVDSVFMLVDNKKDAYRMIEQYEVRIPGRKARAGVRTDIYIEASIHYSSALQVDVPDNVLWEYYIPNKKIRNIRLGD